MATKNASSKVSVVNPNESLSIPEWIQEDYFQEILEKDYPHFKRILKFTPIAATGPGENYTSIMVRVHIDVELEDSTIVQASYILKTMLENAATSAILNNMSLFPKEKEIYETILPQFEKMYAEAGKPIRFGAECKLVEETPKRITIVLEDLKKKNFQNIDRRFGFDLVHIEQVLKKLAEFHAVSAVHYERFGPYSDHFGESFFKEENRKFAEKLGKLKNKQYLEVLKKWGDCEKYIDMWPSTSQLFDWFSKNKTPDPNELTVLNHGDFWSNNIMFQYNEDGEINETYLVDYQMGTWGTPAQDLYYMITASASYDIRVKEFDRFLRIYHQSLADNLKLLQYSKPIPSLKDLHIIMIKYSFWSYFTATSIMPTILIDPITDANIDNLFNSSEYRYATIMNPRYVKAMKQLLPWWENRGVISLDD